MCFTKIVNLFLAGLILILCCFCFVCSSLNGKYKIHQTSEPNNYIIHRKIYIDESFYDNQKEQIVNGIEAWATATDGILSFEAVTTSMPHEAIKNYKNFSLFGGSGIYVFSIDENNLDKQIMDALLEDKTEILAFSIEHVMFIRRDTRSSVFVPNFFKAMAMHETGHLLGLDDTDDINDVMSGYCKEPNCKSGNPYITANDIKAFCDVSKLCEVE